MDVEASYADAARGHARPDGRHVSSGRGFFHFAFCGFPAWRARDFVDSGCPLHAADFSAGLPPHDAAIRVDSLIFVLLQMS